LVPRFSFEFGFRVFAEVRRNLSESSRVSFLEERGFQGIDDDLFGFFNNILGLIVLSNFGGPFFIFQGFVGIDFSDLFFNNSSESDFFFSNSNLFISNGDFFGEFGF